jgi:hypothetical protein
MRYSYMLLGQYADDPYNVKGVIPTLINERYPKFITLGRSASYLVKNWELANMVILVLMVEVHCYSFVNLIQRL